MIRRLRGQGASTLVAVLSAAFGVVLLEVTSALSSVVSSNGVTGSSATVAVMLPIVAVVFIAIAVYVGAIVTANTFATIVAGRTRTIALYRLIGSSARAERRVILREGLAIGVIGSVVGAAIGVALSIGLVRMSVAEGLLPGLGYRFFEPIILLPIVAVVLSTCLASWVGSRSVLAVMPIQAIGSAVGRTLAEVRASRARNVVALVLFVVGSALLVVGMIVGLVSPVGVLIGVFGGLLSFSGVVLGAPVIMPVALRLTGAVLGTSAPAKLAAGNASRYPERSARSTIGLVIGVTLVTMFAVTVESFRVFILRAQSAQPEVYQGVDQTLVIVVVIFSVLIGFSALIAAIGLVNSLALGVIQRTRELGLLRALGFTARQVRLMIIAESAQLTVTAVVVGLVLGIFYGWAGAQSLLGSIKGSPGFLLPAIPIALLLVLVVGSAILTLVASVAPSRRATGIAPVAALAAD